jgi:uncharacterized membrane protein
MSITRRFKGYFVHGLAVLLPTILTIWLFVWGYTFIQENISVYINRGLVRVIAFVGGDRIKVSDNEVRAYLLAKKPELDKNPGLLEIEMKRADVRRRVRIQQLEKIWVHGPGSIAGFVVALIGVFIFGALLASVVGRSLWRMVERFLMNTPVLRRVYPYVKQITDFLFTQEEQKKLLSRVVAVEYPRRGIWSVGFVTGSGLAKVTNSLRKEFLTIIIPTSPTPFTGFVILVPKKLTLDLDMTVEEALRFVISGGVITPGTGPAVSNLPKPGYESQELGMDVEKSQ